MLDHLDHASRLPLIVIMSVPREPVYIHQTLASLFMSDPLVHKTRIHVMVDAPDAAYLENYAHHPNLTVQPLTPTEVEQTEAYWVHRRHAHNYHRCLAMSCEGHSGLCICEDDLVFRHGFLTKLVATIAQLEVEHPLEKYVLAAYAPYDFGLDRAAGRIQSFCGYPAAGFYGNQCLYYPRTVLDDLAPLFYEQAVRRAVAPSDMVVKEYCRQSAVLYACTRSLAQHVGRVTTGLGNFHDSPTFAAENNSLTLDR
jgi:hypothetical protein